MSNYITIVIEYENDQEQPEFTAGMTCMGGDIVAVQFNDALADDEE